MDLLTKFRCKKALIKLGITNSYRAVGQPAAETRLLVQVALPLLELG